jgi:hypothetical protein
MGFLLLFFKNEGLACLLVLLMALRLALACTATPILGYANNLDFFRQSSCVGVWQDYGDRPRIAAHMEGPVDLLVYDGTRIGAFCMRSSDNLFVWAVAHLHRKHSAFPLREVGAAKAITAVLAVLAVMCQPVGAAVRLALAAAFLLVFGDIATLAYFNTLYLDASAIMSGTVLAGLAVVLGARRVAPPRWLCGFGAVLLLWLGCSKPQFLLLAVALGGVMAWLVWRGWRLPARAAALAAAGVLAPLLFLALNADPHGVFRGGLGGNVEDTVMATVLPVAPDKPRALRVLGLPASCMAGLGETGFAAQTSGHNPCPQVDVMSRFRLLRLFVAEPATFLRPMWLAVTQSQAGLAVLPHFARPADGTGWPFGVLAATSLSVWLAALPRGVFGVLVVVLGTLGLACLPVWLARRGAAPGFASAGAVLWIYALGSAVFGDGYVEVARHEALAFSGLVFIIVGLSKARGNVPFPPKPPSVLKTKAPALS